ncbi:molybdenum ABC transporter ATP-binding protein [Pseudomonas oryzihabitans]|uniref:molybdenum ABC transporter ATP-binding protein n=1 Tax=Pseudomonas oryzihabitans TaxID=47885 RepID=UPI00241C7394|nr:molybdenum ABC transporter ATP-binding protein [Pseudomonas oryzihabitans]
MSLTARFELSHPGFTLDVDLALPGRGVTALFGPSGSGKTSCLRCVAGLEPAARGRLVVAEETWQDSDRGLFLPPHRRALGYVFQDANLFEHLDVRRNLLFGWKRVAPAARRLELEQVVELLGIEGLLARMPARLSGGERQRVGIARALLTSPRLLLMDEPLAALDAQLREQLRADIGALLRELGTTAVYVTHDQQEALALGDRIVVMGEGRIAQIGTPTQIYQRPASRFVAGFVGQLNRFEVRAHSGAEVAVAGGRLPWTGAASTLFCRPEHLEPSATPAHLTGILVGQFFQGAHSRLLVEVGTGQPLLVDTAQPLQAQPGDLLHLNVRPDALFTLAS